MKQRSAAVAGQGIATGILAGMTAVGVAYLVAGVTGAVGFPVVAVGELSIDHTPPFVKNFAIREFGSHDKLVLLTGIAVILTLFAAFIGVLAMRRPRYGLAGLGVFGVIGLIAVLTRPNAGAGDLLPTIAGVAAAAAAMWLLLRAARRPAAAAANSARVDTSAPARDAAAAAAAAGPAAPAGPSWAPRTAAVRSGAGEPARRSFLLTGAAVAGTAVVAGTAGRLLLERGSVSSARSALRIPAPHKAALPLPPGTDLKIPGLSSFLTPSSTFYRVDTAIVVPEVAPASWQLRIHGMVQREIVLTYRDLIRRPLSEEYITLACVSNPVAGPYIGNARWLGASLRSLLREAGIRAGADQLLCTSADGFTSGTPVQTAMDGRDAMLAVAMNGQPLPVGHGFPVRMVVPGLYGYVSATKWITDIEVTTFAANTAYWPQRGWSQQAPIKTESRIDVPSGTAAVKPGKTAVAGVAWAQHKGVDAVEVRADDGPWNQARLAAVPGIDTWRQWVWEDWNATAGSHVLEVRATDATGYTQTAAQVAPEPNGATGYASVMVKVSA